MSVRGLSGLLDGSLVQSEYCFRSDRCVISLIQGRYLSNRPATTITNFFGAVDKWQSTFILAQHAKASQPDYGSSSSSCNSTRTLPSSVIQLLFAEPSLLENPELSSLIDSVVSLSPPAVQSSITALGLTVLLVRLLTSPDRARRQWAIAHLPATARRPLSLQDWVESGIGGEIQRLYEGELEVELSVRCQAIKAIIESNSLSRDAVKNGLLGAQVGDKQDGRPYRGVMPALSGLLGAETDGEASPLSS